MIVFHAASRRRRARLPGPVFGLVGLVGLFVGLCAGLLATPPAAAQPPASQEWHLVEAGDLVFVSQVPPAEVEPVAAALGALRRVVGETTTLVPRGPVPVRFYVFRDEGSQRPYHHDFEGEPALLSGAFYPGPHADFVTLSARRQDQSVVTAGHEYLHTVLHTQLPGAPLWLEEGLAEFFGQLRYAEGPTIEGTVAVLGLPVTDHLRTLDDLGWTREDMRPDRETRTEGTESLDLAGLLLLGSDSPDYHDFDAQRSFYARSWLLVHRLVLGSVGRRLEAWDFVAARGRGLTLSRAYESSFGLDPAAFVDELRSHSASLPYRSFDVTGSAPTVSTRRLGRGELLVYLGELLATAGRSEDAALHFRLAFEAAAEGEDPRKDPKPSVASRAVAGLGYVHEIERDWSRARAQYARAVELTPDDPLAAFRYGASLLVLGRATSAARLAEARHLLRKATMLDPALPPR